MGWKVGQVDMKMGLGFELPPNPKPQNPKPYIVQLQLYTLYQTLGTPKGLGFYNDEVSATALLRMIT